MLIIICILGFLLLCSIFINFSMWHAFSTLIDENPQLVLQYYFEHEVEEKFPCSLLLSIKEGADFDGSVFDFSNYEKNKIIGLTEFRKETTSNGKYEDDEGDPVAALLPNQMVCKMKDGSFQWDFRRLM